MATTFKFNPFTGTFDIVGTTGGGGGTVTSITFANGLSASPNPITVAGTASLDIDSLAHEPSLAAGDEFAFVDVSVGTSPAAQRKVTFAEIAAAITPSGAAGGDLSGTYPNPTVAKINTVPLGTTTATSAHLLIADGSAWQSVAMSGDATIAAAGALTLASVIVAGGPTGSSTQIPVITWDAKGRLLAVTTAAAATGTVTSVAGGVGITNSPEPITTTGTVDLDINSLTTETTVASGDLFAMVDVSVGTSPASQRKVTASSIVSGITPLIDHNSLANLTVGDPHTQYLYLAGRAGGQTARGGTLTTQTLTLRANATDAGKVVVASAGNDTTFTVGVGGSSADGEAMIVANSSDDGGTVVGPTLLLQTNATTQLTLQYEIASLQSLLEWSGLFLKIRSNPTGALLTMDQGGAVTLTGDSTGLTGNFNAQGISSTFGPNNNQVGAQVDVAIGTGGVQAYPATLTLNAGTSGATQATISLARDSTAKSQWFVDGTNTIFDYTGAWRIRAGIGGTEVIRVGSTGKVGIGATTLTSLLNVGSADQFQVNATGNLVKLNNVTTSAPTSNVLGYLHNDGSGNWVWQAIPGSDITGAALTRVDDTNVTLTLGGTPATALLRATSLTLGWTGQLSIARGGTGQATAAAAFDALAPTTTRGDLIVRNATTNTRLALGAASTVLGSDGTDAVWVAAGAKGGGLPTCTNTQTLRATGTDTWAASSVLTNDGTDLVDSGKLTVQGSTITAGTAGTSFTANIGQGTTGTDTASVIVKSGNGSGGDAQLILKRNTTEGLKFTAAGGPFALPSMVFNSVFSMSEAGGNLVATWTNVAMTFGTIGTAFTTQVGTGTTGTDNATLTIRSGNSGTTAPILNWNRNGTDVMRMTYDGTDNFLDYIGNLKFRTSIAGTAKLVLDTNGAFTTYRNQTTAGGGVPAILNETLIATQTANATVLTHTPAATAARYRVSGVITTTSATNTGTVQFTLDYKDSQGTTHTGDIMPLSSAAGTFATTQTGASKEFHAADWYISIDNSATAIVLKVVKTGTVSYTAAGSVERVS